MPRNHKSLIDTLRQGGMLSHPGIAAHMRRALATGDYSMLDSFVRTNPVILATARQNVTLAEHQVQDNPFRPYPHQREAAEQLSGPWRLGYINEYNDMFGVILDILCRLMIVIGRMGSGKSNFIKYLLWQALCRENDFNILIPDLKREYRHLLPITKNLKIINVDQIQFNPLEAPAWCRPQDHLVAFARTFVSENYLIGASESMLIETLTWLYKERGIFDGSRNYPTLRDLFNVVKKQEKSTRAHRKGERLDNLINRLQPFVLSGKFDAQSGIPFETLRSQNLVLEMDTGFTNYMYNFVVATMVNQLYMYNKAQGLIGSRLRHWINVDEARILFQAQRNVSMYGESIINELVTKTREFGIGFSILSQETSSISNTLRSIAYLKLAFPLNDKADIDFIRKSFGLDQEQTAHLFKMPPFGQAVVRYGGYPKPFMLQVPHFRIKRQVSNEEVTERMSGFWQALQQSKPQPVQAQTPSAAVAPDLQIPPQCAALLFFLGKNPFCKTTELKEAPGFNSPAEVNKTISWLEENQFISRESYKASRTKKTVFTVLQPKALEYLGSSGPPGKGGFEHRLYQHLIGKWAEAQGAKAKIEGRMKGSAKAIDVLCDWPEQGFVAYEVTLHFENLTDNVLADLEAGLDNLVIVTRDKASQQKAEDIVTGNMFTNRRMERIHFRTMDHYFKAHT